MTDGIANYAPLSTPLILATLFKIVNTVGENKKTAEAVNL
jgi:hypothetical protein